MAKVVSVCLFVCLSVPLLKNGIVVQLAYAKLFKIPPLPHRGPRAAKRRAVVGVRSSESAAARLPQASCTCHTLIPASTPSLRPPRIYKPNRVSQNYVATLREQKMAQWFGSVLAY